MEESVVKVDVSGIDELIRKGGKYYARRINENGEINMAEVQEDDGSYFVKFPGESRIELSADPEVFFVGDRSREKRIQFIAPKMLVDAFDGVANAQNVSRSYLLREAMVYYMFWSMMNEPVFPEGHFEPVDLVEQDLGYGFNLIQDNKHP